MYRIILVAFLLCGTIFLSNGGLMEEFEKEKNKTLSLVNFLEKIETRIPGDNGSCEYKPGNCAEIFLLGETKSGIYTIYPRPWYKKPPFKVYCDMSNGGGWTVIQRRDDYSPQQSFFRNWKDYKTGFGNLGTDFWIGNRNLFLLTNEGTMRMRIDLADFEAHTRFAEYGKFQVDNDNNNYKLSIGDFTGNVADHLSVLNGVDFVTFDRNDVNNCSQNFKGGWWYMNCHRANPNGLYLRGYHTSYADGVDWEAWRGNTYSLKRVEMKIRPNNYLQYED